MGNKTMRVFLAIAAVLLVISHFAHWLGSIWNTMAGVIGGLIVIGVSIVCSRLARSGPGNVGWFLVPVLLFTVVPAVAKAWKFFTEEKTMLSRLIEIAPFLIGFVVPLGLILLVYVELRDK